VALSEETERNGENKLAPKIRKAYFYSAVIRRVLILNRRIRFKEFGRNRIKVQLLKSKEDKIKNNV